MKEVIKAVTKRIDVLPMVKHYISELNLFEIFNKLSFPHRVALILRKKYRTYQENACHLLVPKPYLYSVSNGCIE